MELNRLKSKSNTKETLARHDPLIVGIFSKYTDTLVTLHVVQMYALTLSTGVLRLKKHSKDGVLIVLRVLWTKLKVN